MLHTKTTATVIMNELKSDLANWMDAREDLVWRPEMRLTKLNNEFTVRAFLPGVDIANVEVLIAPEMLLVKGQTQWGKLMRSVTFPQPVNPDRVQVDLKNGMLTVKAAIAQGMRTDEFIPLAA